jgi:hypothetical protein
MLDISEVKTEKFSNMEPLLIALWNIFGEGGLKS